VKVKEGAERVKVSTGFDWSYPILFRCLHCIATMSDAYPPLDGALIQRLQTLGVRPADVEERFVRGTGPGGQKINKTSSTVWLRHGPTGVEVRCQRERSQADNRAAAWTELADRVEQRRRLAAAAVEQAREKERRRHRQKSRGQKARMVAEKKHHARHKALRGRVASDD
jgi:protein subunit release factor B